MNQQFQTRFLLEDLDEFESLRSALLQLGASEDTTEMLTNAVIKGHIEPSKAIEIVKSTTGLSEDGVGGGSTTGGGVTNGASFTPGAGEQYASRGAFKKVKQKGITLEDASNLTTQERLIKQAEKEGHIKGDYSQAILKAAKQVAKKFDTLVPEEQKSMRDVYYKAFLKTAGLNEDAPMLAHGKADISTYTNDKFTRAEGHPKLKSIEPKDLWGTKPTAMSENDYDEPDFTAADDDGADNLSEMSLKNPGMPEFISYLKDNPEAVTKLGFRKLQDVIEYLENANLGDWDELRSELNQIVGGKDIGIYEQDDLNENYHRFKRETRERPKQDQYHEAIRTVNKKLDEVNRILEFTTRMKNELAEEGEILEVKSRTAKTMDKMKMKIAEAYQKLKKLN